MNILITFKGIFLILLLSCFFFLFELVPYDRVVPDVAAEETEEEEDSEECDGDECEDEEDEEECEDEECEDEEDEEPSEEYIEGKKLYDGLCSPCHGFEGDGKGFAHAFTWPKPRDFTFAIFKFSSTPSGDAPTDEDIINVIKKGTPGTSMPAWERIISTEKIMLILEYIKEEFSYEAFEFEPEPFEIGDPPEATPDLIKLGRKIFEKAKCWECHGQYVRGDGEKGWQAGMKDDWGERIYPANLTHPWEIRNFATVKDLFRSVTTGLDGTPMASYETSYSNDERWALAYYLKSIQVERVFKNTLTVKKVDKIPTATDDTIWDKTEFADLLIGGKKLFGQKLIPMITNLRLRGVHTGSDIALMLEWVDKMPNKGDDGRPPDSVEILFPAITPTGNPLIDKGDRRVLFDVWGWNAVDDRASEKNKKGRQLIKKKQTSVRAVSSYKNGLYRVIFMRNKKTKSKGDFTFKEGKENLYIIRVYDGENLEQGDRGGVTARRHLILE